MEKEPSPESAAVHDIALQRELNSPSKQHFTDRAANSAADPDGMIR